MSDDFMRTVGERIRSAVDFHREEACEHSAKATRIDSAWAAWDIDALEDDGAIDADTAAELRAMRDAGRT